MGNGLLEKKPLKNDCMPTEQGIGSIRVRFEELYSDEKFKNIINFSDVRKGELFINIIHYDKNIKNDDNIKYYRYFSIDTVGGYYPFDDYEMLKVFILKLNELSFKCSYILMISGNETEKILEEFHKYDYLVEFIIFNRQDNFDYLNNKYNKIKLITNEFNSIRKHLKSKKFSKEDLSMDNHLFITPVITYYDYKKALFPIHRILAYFFKYNYREYYFPKDYFIKAKEFIDKSTFDKEIKDKIIKIMEYLVNIKNREDFTKACIKYYTGENLCYVFNKALRNFEKFYVEMCYFIGPFYLGLFNYSLYTGNKYLKTKINLYRDLIMDKLEFYYYKFCENDIICFPSFTSTTLNENLNFKPSKNAREINNIEKLDEKNFIKMIISYNPDELCIPQALDISEDAKFSNEKEVLLFPFTFLKIDKIEMNSGTQNDKHYIYLTIINKKDFLEEGLNKNYSFKLIENGTKLAVDEDNDLKCDNNELYYNMYYNEIKEIIEGENDEIKDNKKEKEEKIENHIEEKEEKEKEENDEIKENEEENVKGVINEVINNNNEQHNLENNQKNKNNGDDIKCCCMIL